MYIQRCKDTVKVVLYVLVNKLDIAYFYSGCKKLYNSRRKIQLSNGAAMSFFRLRTVRFTVGLRNRGALSLWHCSKASLLISVVNLCNECATKETTSSISKKTATLGNVSIYLFATVWSSDLTRPETCCHSESSLVVLEPKSVFMGSPSVQCGMFYVNSTKGKNC